MRWKQQSQTTAVFLENVGWFQIISLLSIFISNSFSNTDTLKIYTENFLIYPLLINTYQQFYNDIVYCVHFWVFCFKPVAMQNDEKEYATVNG